GGMNRYCWTRHRVYQAIDCAPDNSSKNLFWKPIDFCGGFPVCSSFMSQIDSVISRGDYRTRIFECNRIRHALAACGSFPCRRGTRVGMFACVAWIMGFSQVPSFAIAPRGQTTDPSASPYALNWDFVYQLNSPAGMGSSVAIGTRYLLTAAHLNWQAGNPVDI